MRSIGQQRPVKVFLAVRYNAQSSTAHGHQSKPMLLGFSIFGSKATSILKKTRLQSCKRLHTFGHGGMGTGREDRREMHSAPRSAPNPSIEGTRNGMPRMAFISFWAMRVLPLRAPHVKR